MYASVVGRDHRASRGTRTRTTGLADRHATIHITDALLMWWQICNLPLRENGPLQIGPTTNSTDGWDRTSDLSLMRGTLSNQLSYTGITSYCRLPTASFSRADGGNRTHPHALRRRCSALEPRRHSRSPCCQRSSIPARNRTWTSRLRKPGRHTIPRDSKRPARDSHPQPSG